MIQVRLEKGEVTPDALLLTGHISKAIGPRSCQIEEGAQYVGENGLAYPHGGGVSAEDEARFAWVFFPGFSRLRRNHECFLGFPGVSRLRGNHEFFLDLVLLFL